MFCTKCNAIIESSEYDTGIESYCKCQCTLNAEFNNDLWVSDPCPMCGYLQCICKKGESNGNTIDEGKPIL